MLDIQSVNFTSRHRNCHYDCCSQPNNDSVSGKQIAGLTLAAGGTGYALKSIKLPLDLTNNVVLEMHKENLKGEQKKLNIISSIIGQMEKEKSTTLSPHQTELLQGIVGKDKMPNPEENVLEVLKKVQTKYQATLDAKTPKVINKKIKALEHFIKKSETVVDNATNANPTTTQKITDAVKKNNEKGLDGLTKKIAKLFHMEIDKTTGQPKEKITAEKAKELLQKTKEESEQLYNTLKGLRKDAEAKIANCKLLPADDIVAKAWKKAKLTNIGKMICAIGIPLIAIYTIFGDKINNFLSK